MFKTRRRKIMVDMAISICISLFALVIAQQALSREPLWPRASRLRAGTQRINVGENKAATGWNDLEINPNAFMQVVYQGFRFNVYATKGTDVFSTTHFYFPPGLFVNSSSAHSYLNTLTNRNEMSFKVLMWDEEFEIVIRNAVSRKTGQNIPVDNVRVLPIEQIRIDAPSIIASKYEVVNQWMSYASQPSIFEFRFSCTNKETCDELAAQVRENPQFFVYDLQVSYSLIAQRSARRTIQVTAEHVQAGQLYTQLKQQVPNSDVVYLQADDLKQMTLEIATNVMATEVIDDEFIGQDQSLSITKILESLLQVKPESSASFQAQMWDSVFWSDENTRPDRVTNTLNEVYDKADDELKNSVKDFLQSSQNSSTGIGVNGSGWGVSVAVNTAVANSEAFESNYERDEFMSTLREAASKSQWSGERFVVKPMQLSRTNIARLQSSATITSVQVRVTKSAAELTSRINLLPSVLPTVTVPATISPSNTPTGTIQMFYGVAIPDGWLRCDGSQVNCTQYRDLCRVLRNVHDDGDEHMTTPDMRGRVPLASSNGENIELKSGDGSSSFYFSVGETGGEVNHRLTKEELPEHKHNYWTMETTNKNMGIYPHNGKHYHLYTYQNDLETEELQDTNPVGQDESHNIMQPYVVVQFMIKT